MRTPRLKVVNAPAVYHCMSRIAGGNFLLDDNAKIQLRTMLMAEISFSGADLITYTIMDNHFHVVVRIDPTRTISDDELLARVMKCCGAESRYVRAIQQDLISIGTISPMLRQRLTRRMNDVSAFMKELKERFSRWFNKTHNRYGTLWAERFKSVLVEDGSEALRAICAYVDLNCVRAGLVDDPAHYRFCGYSEALGQASVARQGLSSFLPGNSWDEKLCHYRKYLFCRAAESGHSGKKSVDRSVLLKKLKTDGHLDLPELLRLKISYFSRGIALGERRFVDSVIIQFRHHFSSRRTPGARPLKGTNWQDTAVLREPSSQLFS